MTVAANKVVVKVTIDCDCTITQVNCSFIGGCIMARETLGKRLDKCLKRNDLSRIELAQRIDVDRRHVHNWIHDANKPNAKNLLAIAKVLGVSPDELLG